ncbi:hypothetical protein WJX73_003777 [Symbiochloris irregularis]|uniref:Thylakoid membrane protein n=1 Tax=Symbiochloris irregularis TaxID=706552 RepID=A0AAW1NN95_9CHLO
MLGIARPCSGKQASQQVLAPCVSHPLATRAALVSHCRTLSPSQRAPHRLGRELLRHRELRGGGCTARAAAGGEQYVDLKEFRIEQISFGKILTPVGVVLLSYGFASYFNLLPSTPLSAIIVVTGFPLTLLGFALSYAQLEPVPCRSTQSAIDARESQMTDIQRQVREDVTRYRYGDEQHLDEALARVFMFGRPSGIPRRLSPRLKGVREELLDGRYTLVLEFQTRKDMTKDMWDTRVDKIQTFFGPGIAAEVNHGDKGAVDVVLKCDGSGQGRGGPAQKDVLMPLVPGGKARQQKQAQ